MAQCMFCGANQRRLTKEHLYGDSFASLVNQDSEGMYVVGTYADSKRGTHSPKGRKSPGMDASDMNVRLACRDCNSGWLNDLHVSARATVSRMIGIAPTTLTGVESGRLAQWAYGRAMILSRTWDDAKDAIPRQDWEALRAEQMSTSRIAVLAFRTGRGVSLPTTRFQGATTDAGGSSSHFQASLRLRNVLLVCFGTSTLRCSNEPKLYREWVSRALPGKSVRLWPEPRKAKWPPAAGVLTAEQAENVTMSLNRRMTPSLDIARRQREHLASLFSPPK